MTTSTTVIQRILSKYVFLIFLPPLLNILTFFLIIIKQASPVYQAKLTYRAIFVKFSCTGNAVIYFYTEDNKEIAQQFGPDLDDPWFYNVDLDGDGVDEMICPCVYTADNCPCVLIYRKNNGVIEVGYPDYSRFEKLAGAELYTLNSYSKYDFETDRIVLYYKKEELAELTIDDYVFSEYEPEYYFRDNDIWPNDAL